jgi:nucleoside-diphosphate-sugar epimerase
MASLRVFITGIGGALGARLVPALAERGATIVGNDYKEPESVYFRSSDMVEYLWKATEDITARDVEQSDVVVNLSATADRPLGLSSPWHTVANNVMPTVNLLEACTKAGVGRFIQLGSGTIYLGVARQRLPAVEETTPCPANPYSASKYAQDVLCQSYCRGKGLPVIVVRSGMTYGGGRLSIAPHRFILRAMQNQPLYVRGGDQTRTPTHIDDVVRYCLAVIDAPIEQWRGRVVHAVYPTSRETKGAYSLREMAQMVKSATGSNSPIVESDYEDGESLENGPVHEWIISTTAGELGVTPMIDFARGLPMTVDWLRETKGGIAGRFHPDVQLVT